YLENPVTVQRGNRHGTAAQSQTSEFPRILVVLEINSHAFCHTWSTTFVQLKNGCENRVCQSFLLVLRGSTPNAHRVTLHKGVAHRLSKLAIFRKQFSAYDSSRWETNTCHHHIRTHARPQPEGCSGRYGLAFTSTHARALV